MAEKPRASHHPDFKPLEASRPPFDPSKPPAYVQTPDPSWRFGQGPNHLYTPADAAQPFAVIDPNNHDRPAGSIYKLLISSVVPRPIALISSASADGTALNLAPFSYFNLVAHDPPLFAAGFTGSIARPKDTLRNVLESREAVVNIISEHYVEAANATSVDAPYGCSEWDVSGLTPDFSTQAVRAPRVKEAILSIEVKVVSVQEFDSRIDPEKKSAVVVIFEGVRFWIREDALDENKLVNPAVLKPVTRLGGISYGRTQELFELQRPSFQKDLGGQEGFDNLKKPAN
ncbi:Uncharacterized protein ESCO_000118 [Escovopsis weberi]|uniref:Flavin reductase like domain-containing protein n=1 Tax=Escovopsis weberi TaxID=150374 RepID=A0A0M9VT62_ESCWE|nr:Uncharacterized protein ESCO_000118 [Escovopsis weberi]